jgi:UPF0042 nucleotide-binding protein
MNRRTENNPVIVTGLSGAGLSSVLKNLEDLGFEIFDNFPLSHIQALVEETPAKKAIAIGVDSRTRGFTAGALLDTARAIDATLLFITSDDTVLQKRFTHTRRRHPLAKAQPVMHGIQQERTLLQPLIEKADLTIDTSALSVHDLRHILEGHFGAQKSDSLHISIVSFAYRHGLPREADIVMDVRFLRNPHWDPALKDKTGLDTAVGAYIAQDPDYSSFLEHLKALIAPLLPRYIEEGKHYLTIAIGCTGGQHRSVFVTETLGKWLESLGYPTHKEHKELKK